MKVADRYVYLFCGLYLILPEFLGIEFSSSLPILTAARIMVLLLVGITVVYCIKNKKFRVLSDKVVWFVVGGYFIFRLVSNLYYLSAYADAANNIIKMIVEEIIFLLVFPLFLVDESRRIAALKAIVYGCTFISALGIAESVTGVRVTDYLYTVSRPLLNDYYIRLGLLRATTSFGLSNLFAFYLTMNVPLILWLWKYTGQKRYLIIVLLNFFALIFTGCRGNLLTYFLIIAVYPLLLRKDERRRFFRRLCLCLCVAIALITVQRGISPKLKYYYDGTVKSLLNVVGFKFDLNEGAPEGVSGYGRNGTNGVASRLDQFTAITYTMGVNPLFGLGAGAQNRGEVLHYGKGEWKFYSTYDVGYVAAICDEGIIGAVGYLILYLGFPLFYALQLRREKDEKRRDILKLFLTINVVYLICILFAINRLSMYFFINAIGLSFTASFKDIKIKSV